MALLVNGRFLRRQATGLHRAARTLLSELRRTGYALEIFAPAGTRDDLVDRKIPGLPSDAVWEQTSLPAVAHGRLVFSPTNTAPLLGRNIVWTHDLGPLVNPEWYAGRRARYYGRVTLAAALRARSVFAPSRQVADELVGAGVAASRVHVLRSPVDPRFRPPAEQEVQAVREQFGLTRDYLVLVGCFSPRKDAPFAVEAHLAAYAEEPHDLVLVGAPHGMFAPVRWATAPSVHAIGYVPDDLLPALVGGAAALISPSRYEGYGLPPLEALACGTPALVSDVPAHRESTWELAELLPLDELGPWKTAIVRALRDEISVPADLPKWTATDMAAQFAAGLPEEALRTLQRRG